MQGVWVWSLVGELRSHMLWPKSKNIRQKQYCKKINKDFKNGSHKKKILKKIKRNKGLLTNFYNSSNHHAKGLAHFCHLLWWWATERNTFHTVTQFIHISHILKQRFYKIIQPYYMPGTQLFYYSNPLHTILNLGMLVMSLKIDFMAHQQVLTSG